MTLVLRLAFLSSFLHWFAVGAILGQDASVEDAAFFENKVRPILVERCFGCHGEKEQKGGLRLDSLADMLSGGDSGSALVAHQPADSLLIQAVRYEGLEMPPDGKLPEEEIGILERWVTQGAFWPNSDGKITKRAAKDKITAEDRAWWAFQPIKDAVVPEILLDPALGISESWKTDPIDRFVLSKMQEKGLVPAPEADRLSLIRRLSYDMIGLPPTAEEVRQFVSDDSTDAYERLVNRLLDSPHYGERWARHWLDLVRYADSDGYRIDHYRPYAWQYRDYVIRSLNSDKPYDRFVQEQLAGDELFPGDEDALIATGFLRHWIYEYNSRDAKGQWETILNDVTDTTGDVFLGLGMQCAKCHDHKFDPILQKDYYRLQAFFAAIFPQDRTVANDGERQAYFAKLAEWEKATESLRAQIAEIEAPFRAKAADQAVGRFPPDTEAAARKPSEERNGFERQIAYLIERQVDFEYSRLDDLIKGDEKEKRLALKKQLAAFEHLRPKELPVAMTVTDVGSELPETYIPKKKSAVIKPGYLTIFADDDASIEAVPNVTSSGRRATLAKWLTRAEHPLTTRVIVNRIWQYHFGKGLAPNSSDLGRLGGEPSHPELLDWLTLRFVEGGWSFKKLHRMILLSATYRQAAKHPRLAEQQSVDPLNQYYWRSDVRRLDAEQIRDGMLAVCGLLKVEREMPVGGEGVMGDVPRRSIYMRVMRNARDPLLDSFDLPLFFSSESTRNTTTTPVQSLMLINSPQLLQYATALARRVEKEKIGEAMNARIEHLWKIVYGRGPSDDELRYAAEFVKAQTDIIEQNAAEKKAIEVAQSKIPYRDGLAISIRPNDPTTRMRIGHDERLNVADFTIEAFVQLRSIYDSGNVRTIVSKWSGSGSKPGWAFGVTGKGSRRKPQTLVLQMHGRKRDGSFGEGAVFSDQNVSLNSPYYVAAAVKLATDVPGTVTFFLKDLSNDDEPLQSITVEHEIVGKMDCTEDFTIGGRSSDEQGLFDGLIDDVRISRGVLSGEEILYGHESALESTLGYWRFEQQPGVMADSSANALTAKSSKAEGDVVEPALAAFRDLCHALLNSSEFLYVR